ncbi:glutaminase [Calothrix sp. NIES-4071]|nr:glutaminase [Calothrix sp. NIES-4071]BAZ60643.1 glutaminase [Calothrix sp. NIES-4105]
MTDTKNTHLTTSTLSSFLNDLYSKYKSLQTGTVANYIPELAKVNPNLFSICIVTVDGSVLQVGDFEHLFTIQSISKVFVYGLALQDHGRDYVLKRVGVEPTGDAFNSIILDEQSKRPYNPMVNAGAIATTSLIKGFGATERLNRLLEMFQYYVGRDVFVDISVFTSERSTGHRNRAMAHLMLNFGMIDGQIEESLDLYFQQCAVMVNCRDLAVMAAALANKGVNPLTKEQAVDSRYIKDILSIMYTCGMYNFAGEWAYKIGLPAKSGVSGGIIAVVPGQMGIAVFSPLLDERGNSIRGVKVCEELSQQFSLHLFDCAIDKINLKENLCN